MLDSAKALTVFLNGRAISTPAPGGEYIEHDSFSLIFNAGDKNMVFKLPDKEWRYEWLKVLNTAEGWLERNDALSARSKLPVAARSVVVWQHAS